MIGERNALERVWTVAYWVSFVLCWVVLPILTTYLDSCEFTFSGKLCYSIKINLIYYAIEILLVLVIWALYYFLATGDKKVEKGNGLMMALANAWALMQIILLLSNGIIDVPRDFWRKSSNKLQLKTVCCKLRQGEEILDDDRMTIEQCIKQLQAIEMVTNESNKAYINKIYEIIPEDLTSFRALTEAINPDVDVTTSHKKTRGKIADIHYKLKSYLGEYTAHKEYRLLCDLIIIASSCGWFRRGYSWRTWFTRSRRRSHTSSSADGSPPRLARRSSTRA